MHKSTILVVDDSEVGRTLLLNQLAHLGFQADVAENGFVALEKVSAQAYDLILMDIFMPGIDGMETASRIRALQQKLGARPSPIVAISGGADKQTCLHSGLDDFMTKPFLLDDLCQIVERWLHPIVRTSDSQINSQP